MYFWHNQKRLEIRYYKDSNGHVLFFLYDVLIRVQMQLDLNDIENILNSLVQLDVINTL